MMTLYRIKPAFQDLLRPLTRQLARKGITANMVTMSAMGISIVLGVLLIWTDQREYFLLLPAWMFLRMAFNAVDGMLAREFGQKSALGAYLNELSDVISDAALYLPFIMIAPFEWPAIVAVIWLASLSEMAGALGPMVGAPRCYDGPMGKSDRALVFGALGLWTGLSSTLPGWIAWLPWLMMAAIAVNIVNRIRSGLSATARP